MAWVSQVSCAASIFSRITAIIVGILGMQAANWGRVTNKEMSILGIVLGVLSIVLLIVSYATGLNEPLMSGS